MTSLQIYDCFSEANTILCLTALVDNVMQYYVLSAEAFTLVLTKTGSGTKKYQYLVTQTVDINIGL